MMWQIGINKVKPVILFPVLYIYIYGMLPYKVFLTESPLAWPNNIEQGIKCHFFCQIPLLYVSILFPFSFPTVCVTQ